MPSDQAIFPQPTEDDWRRAAGASGARIVTTDDGIALPPIAARRADGAPVADRTGWGVIQRLTGQDAAAVAREAAEAVAGGANGVEIVFDGSVHPLPSRLPVASANRVAEAVAGLPRRDLVIRVDAGEASWQVAQTFAGAGIGHIHVAYDPVAGMAARWDPTPGVAGKIAEAAGLAAAGTVATFASADGRIWHAAGATEAQELAAVAATVVALVRHAGIPPDRALAGISVAIVADVDPFLTIAKLRAARLLLLRIAELLETSSVPTIHAETAWRAMSKREPRMNVLRAGTGALAAAAGGADTIAVLPYDTALDTQDADPARLARNTHAILSREARLADVADPAAGSGVIEAISDALAAAAWQKFQALEAAGGIIAEIVAGSLQPEIAKARKARLDRVARGEATIIGVNAHVDGAAATRAPADDGPDTVLTFVRLSQAFEGAGEIVS